MKKRLLMTTLAMLMAVTTACSSGTRHEEAASPNAQLQAYANRSIKCRTSRAKSDVVG